jgi:predicted nucleic acid-binding protein
MEKVVLDANVFVKLFKAEPDSDQAINLIKQLLENRVSIVEPSVVVNETITTCEVNKENIRPVCEFFQLMIDSSIRLYELDNNLIQSAFDITTQGHEKSGYPTFSDSVYHAIAIQEDALFITADKRHYEKVKQLGNIDLLENVAGIYFSNC